MANWVQDSILQEESPRRRAARIKYLISVADVCVFVFVKIECWLTSRKNCRRLQNYSSMTSIIAGLNAAPVRRLKRSWEQVNVRFMVKLGTCETLVDPGRNFKNYRHMLANISPPCVPYVGVYFSFLSGCTRDTYHHRIIKACSSELSHSCREVAKIHYPTIL